MHLSDQKRRVVGWVLAGGLLGGCHAPRPSSRQTGAPLASADGGAVVTFAQRAAGPANRVQEFKAWGGAILGERWGCASIKTEGPERWQCWNGSEATPGQGPHAFSVPWLDGKGIVAARPDRICGQDARDRTLRCWQPPRRGETAGRTASQGGEWLRPFHTTFANRRNRDNPVGAYVGGTFACLRNPLDELWCVGDDRFGQLAAGNPLPDAGPNTPPLFSVWPANSIALGTWHACAVAARGSLLDEAYAACWGRGDFAQLGARAPDNCVVDGKTVPCAKAPVKGVQLKPDGMAVLAAGDLFTCVTDRSGIRCWGASQDGFFGAPGSCPKSLERAWPTPDGPIAAPHARCSATPQPVAGSHDFQQDFRVGPRGLCFPDGNKIRCVGAIPTPRLDNVAFASVSPGQDASACTGQNGTVLCWGEGYSPPGALDEPVAVVLERPEPASEVAVVRSSNAAEWSASCLVHAGCATAPVAVPRCAPDLHADDWSQILLAAPTLVGNTVHARGLLAVGPMSSTLVGCRGHGTRACCNHPGGPVVLGGAAKLLALDGLQCSGDESLICCNAPAYGQSVVATGELVEETGVNARGAPWRLDHPTLCSESSDADRR